MKRYTTCRTLIKNLKLYLRRARSLKLHTHTHIPTESHTLRATKPTVGESFATMGSKARRPMPPSTSLAAMVMVLMMMAMSSPTPVAGQVNKCAKCNIPVASGGCKCNTNCDCITTTTPTTTPTTAPTRTPAPTTTPVIGGGGGCDRRCYAPVEQGGCICDSSCSCVTGSAPVVDKCAKCRTPGYMGGCVCNSDCDCIARSKGCTLKSYGRGVGFVPNACPPNYESDGLLLCLPVCASGFHGNLNVCWANCPAGFHDDGAHCRKPASYGRGAGYAAWDWDRCMRDNPERGCEWSGLMIYPKCAPGFHAVGCCVCSPDCPSGFPDIGVSCRKPSYGRGVAISRVCPGSDQWTPGGLCYPRCADGYNGVGPMCWSNTCPSSNPDRCGPFCVLPGTCSEVTFEALKAGYDIGSFAFKTARCASGDLAACIKGVEKIGDTADAAAWIANNMPNCV